MDSPTNGPGRDRAPTYHSPKPGATCAYQHDRSVYLDSAGTRPQRGAAHFAGCFQKKSFANGFHGLKALWSWPLRRPLYAYLNACKCGRAHSQAYYWLSRPVPPLGLLDGRRKLAIMLEYQFGKGSSAGLPPEGLRFYYSRRSARLKKITHQDELFATIRPNGAIALTPVLGSHVDVFEGLHA